MYYLPPSKIKRKSHLDKISQQTITVASSSSSKSVLFINGDEAIESFKKCCKYCEKCKLIYEEIYSEKNYNDLNLSCSSYLKAKDCDIKNCKGPIFEV
jgi:hypothetical protein